jgi:DNA polymerase sigma
MLPVRLSPEALKTIQTCFQKVFASTDHLWLFGSRVDLQKKGGDIDLYIETTSHNAHAVVEQKTEFLRELFKHMEEQKVDIVINRLQYSPALPIYQIAKTTGIKLI